jgi:hypothetical protein
MPIRTIDNARLILPQLKENRIFEIYIKDDQIIVEEMCDEWFGCIFTPDDLRQLATELTCYANAIEEQRNNPETGT